MASDALCKTARSELSGWRADTLPAPTDGPLRIELNVSVGDRGRESSLEANGSACIHCTIVEKQIDAASARFVIEVERPDGGTDPFVPATLSLRYRCAVNGGSLPIALEPNHTPAEGQSRIYYTALPVDDR